MGLTMTPATESSAESVDKEPSTEQIELAYKEACDFKFVFADGTLVRANLATTILTFYTNDMLVKSQSVTLTTQKDGTIESKFAELQEQPVRTTHAVVRLSPEASVELARLIVEQVHKVRPDLTKDIVGD